MRKKDEHLRAALLHHARIIAETEGIDAINIRRIAQNAKVATGTVYNYFSGKDDILLSLTEEYWKQALSEMNLSVHALSFSEQLEEIYTFLKAHLERSASLLMQNLGSAMPTGRQRMSSMHEILMLEIMRRMTQDDQIRHTIWCEDFTLEDYARFLVAHLIVALRSKQPDIRFLIEIIRRTIY